MVDEVWCAWVRLVFVMDKGMELLEDGEVVSLGVDVVVGLVGVWMLVRYDDNGTLLIEIR